MPRKKTEEEYIKELEEKVPHIKLVGNYTNARTKTLHHCLIHDILWEVAPDHVLSKGRCPQCGKESSIRKRRRSKESYVEELAVNNPFVKLTGEYIDTRTHTEYYCEKHNVFFIMRPSDALQGKGCHQCRSEKISQSRMKTEEQYIKELNDKNPNVKLIGSYKGTNIPTKHMCLIHNVIWDAQPANVLVGMGCPDCLSEKISNKLKKPQNEYIRELMYKNPDVELADEYKGSTTPARHYCKIHDCYFDIMPLSALKGAGCKQCTSERIRASALKPQKVYELELSDIHPNIVLKQEYTGTHVNTLHKCLLCGHEWYPKPANLLSGYGCPICNQSKGEKNIEIWLIEHNIDYIPQQRFNDCCDKRVLPFDFYLPNKNICIEYQGQQHYEPVEHFGGQQALIYTQAHDKIKKEYCDLNNIKLVCIPYWEDIHDYLDKQIC